MGDIGDFSKFGLLRVLAGIYPKTESRLALGVVWYVPDRRTIAKTDPGHGQSLGYLDQPREYRACDPDLFDCLRSIVGCDRSLSAVEQSGILGSGTGFWSEPIPLAASARARWMDRALSRTADADVVFLDPDVGLATSNMEQKPQPSPEHAQRNEVRAFMRLFRGQTVVVYQHYPYTARTRQAQVEGWRAALMARLVAEQPRILKSGNREFVVLPAEAHATIIDDRLAALQAGPWGRHFEPTIVGFP